MSWDANVIPGIEAALKSLVGGPTPGNPTVPGKLMSVHVGEQFGVSGRGPVAWIMGSSFNAPEPGGSDLEETDWVVEVRLLFQFAGDQRHADTVLGALIEPLRDVFRKHTKLAWSAATSPTGAAINFPVSGSTIARARVQRGQWLYIAVNAVMYRMLIINVVVKEKVGQTYSVGG